MTLCNQAGEETRTTDAAAGKKVSKRFFFFFFRSARVGEQNDPVSNYILITGVGSNASAFPLNHVNGVSSCSPEGGGGAHRTDAR